MPYLIDGNNLLGSWGGPPPGGDGRSEVVRRVAAFCRARHVHATIVFDGHPLRPDMASQDLGPVSLRVPPQGQDADTVIRELVERAPRASEIVVVTSDKALYSYVKSLGASVLRAHEWNLAFSKIHQGSERDGEKPSQEEDIEGWLKRFGASETR